MSERKNAGYTITDAVKVNDYEIVIGEKPGAPSPYVCWYCRNGDDYFWGAYVGSHNDALEVMIDRIRNEFKYEARTGKTHRTIEVTAEELVDKILKLKNDGEIYVAVTRDEYDGALSDWYFIKRVSLFELQSDFYLFGWCGGGSTYSYDRDRAEDETDEFIEFVNKWMDERDCDKDDATGKTVMYIEEDV